jgi:hypothetical protein
MRVYVSMSEVMLKRCQSGAASLGLSVAAYIRMLIAKHQGATEALCPSGPMPQVRAQVKAQVKARKPYRVPEWICQNCHEAVLWTIPECNCGEPRPPVEEYLRLREEADEGGVS